MKSYKKLTRTQLDEYNKEIADYSKELQKINQKTSEVMRKYDDIRFITDEKDEIYKLEEKEKTGTLTKEEGALLKDKRILREKARKRIKENEEESFLCDFYVEVRDIEMTLAILDFWTRTEYWNHNFYVQREIEKLNADETEKRKALENEIIRFDDDNGKSVSEADVVYEIICP